MPNDNNGSPPGAASATATSPIALPVRQACAISGLSRSALYREAGRKNIVMRKYHRTTLVCMDSVREFLNSLPTAIIRAP